MAKNKLNLKKILCAILFMAMGGLLIGAYFIPVLSNDLFSYNCADIIANGSYEISIGLKWLILFLSLLF